MIGVNTNSTDPKKLKAIMEKEKLNWRSFGSRHVTLKWNASTPGYYVIDHKGVIRHKWLGNTGPGAKAIDRALEKLIHEVEGGTGSETAPAVLDRPQPLPVEVVDAWKVAGARDGWLRTKHLGFRSRQYIFHDVDAERPAAPGDVPAFHLARWKAGQLATLPVPKAAFGLFLSRAEVTDAALKELAGLKKLQRLDLSLTQVTDAGLKELAGLTGLQTLNLDTDRITDAGLKELSELANLQTLELNTTQVTNQGLKELVRLNNLKTLDLGFTKVTDAGLKDLALLKNLQELDLPRTQVTDAGMKELIALENLRLLNVRASRVTDAGLKVVAQLKNLRALNLEYDRITDAGLKNLAPLRNLQSLKLAGTQISDAGLKELAGHKHLQTLWLGGTKVTAGGVAAFQKLAPGCKVIR
jgi:internalin A